VARDQHFSSRNAVTFVVTAAQEIAELRSEVQELREEIQRLGAELDKVVQRPARPLPWTPEEATEMRVVMAGWMADLDAPGMETYDKYAYLFDEQGRV
jgi:hypothetical protein